MVSLWGRVLINSVYSALVERTVVACCLTSKYCFASLLIRSWRSVKICSLFFWTLSLQSMILWFSCFFVLTHRQWTSLSTQSLCSPLCSLSVASVTTRVCILRMAILLCLVMDFTVERLGPSDRSPVHSWALQSERTLGCDQRQHRGSLAAAVSLRRQCGEGVEQLASTHSRERSHASSHR